MIYEPGNLPIIWYRIISRSRVIGRTVCKPLGYILLNEGYDVKVSEVHGMSQRGGSVSTQVIFGDKVNSPVIGKGAADVLVAFEKMELFEKTTGWECNTAPLFLMARTMMNDGYKPFVNKVKSDENLYIFVKDGWDDINLYQTRVIGFAKEYCGLSK